MPRVAELAMYKSAGTGPYNALARNAAVRLSLQLATTCGVPLTTTLHAHAVASSPVPPQAMLSIRTTLATVDSRQSALLNALLGALGGNV